MTPFVPNSLVIRIFNYKVDNLNNFLMIGTRTQNQHLVLIGKLNNKDDDSFVDINAKALPVELS